MIQRVINTLAISILSNGFGWPRDVITGFGVIRRSGGGGRVCGNCVGETDEWRTGCDSWNRSDCGVDDTDENRNLLGTAVRNTQIKIKFI